jgi:Domain of unknown function (DUF4340)
MMKTHRTTYTLVIVFFASLLVLWGLEYYGVRTAKESMLRESLILPELLETPASGIRKLSIERGTERIVFERRDSGALRWQMIEPMNVAAEPSRLETLVRNLKELRRSLDAGSMTGPPATFGLDNPLAVVRLWGSENDGGGAAAEPLATIELGKSVKRLRYLRAGERGTIEVADAKLLNAVDQPVIEWRERALVPLATFQINSVSIKRGTKLIRVIRGRNGRFRLVEPNIAPADGPKVESMLAALASLRVADGAKGFVANDVRDGSPYGLSPPSAIVELNTTQGNDKPLVLEIGKVVPDQPDRIYVRQGDQDDVVTVNAKPVAELPASSVALRSQKVCDFEAVAVSEIRIKAPAQTFLLKKESNGWMQKEPTEEKADGVAVSTLLKQLDSLQTSEFLEPGKVRAPQLDPPLLSIQIRETRVGRTAAASADNELVLVLHIGRRDAARKVFYAQLDRDEAILTLPDTLLDVLPKNALAFRDRSVVSPAPATVRKLTVTRAGRIDELVPEEGGKPNRWRMRRPIDAPADTRTITQILAILANLRAEGFISDNQKDATKFGLDRPLLEVEWETDQPHRLKVGAQVPKEPAYYAATGDQPFVFTLRAETLKPFEAEFREHLVISFPLAKAERMVLTWSRPNRTVAFKHRPPTTKGQLEWVDEPGTDAGGMDLSAASALAEAVSHLETIRYVQYDGEIQPFTGLIHPRLTVAVSLGANEADRIIRVGYAASPGLIYAAEGTSPQGPVFLLPAVSWDALIQSGQRLPPLPDDVFTPTSKSKPR